MSDRAEISGSSMPTPAGSTPAISTACRPCSSTPPGAPSRLDRCFEGERRFKRLRTCALVPREPATKHVISNLSIDVEPNVGRAAAECCFTVLQAVEPGGPIQIVLSGRYVDRFERIAEVWRFADRLFVVDLTGDPTRHFW